MKKSIFDIQYQNADSIKGLLRIIPIMLLIVISSTLLFPQPDQSLVTLYQNNQLETLKHRLESGSVSEKGWEIFIEALFIADADLATRQMMLAYTETNNEKLYTFIRNRVSLFYSARGYYQTAEQIKNNPQALERIISIKKIRQQVPKPNSIQTHPNKRVLSNSTAWQENGRSYGIQIGAYSDYENALNASQVFQADYKNAFVLEKERNNRKLYVVVVGGYSSRQDAAYEIPTINKKFKVKGYIIQY